MAFSSGLAVALPVAGTLEAVPFATGFAALTAGLARGLAGAAFAEVGFLAAGAGFFAGAFLAATGLATILVLAFTAGLLALTGDAGFTAFFRGFLTATGLTLRGTVLATALAFPAGLTTAFLAGGLDFFA
ncbi:MAG TPA: hypothetical protein VE934_14805 [Polaromonas sp.]|nr:hypothetical protein [Polaromonas sp.]HYW58222.1 hypothetical protein [Polaromonas sp.]